MHAPRLVQAPPGVPVGTMLARGEVELAFQQLSELINLPDVGIKGNSHMVMMDKNNGAVADVIQRWLVAQGLTSDGTR